jgi:hypothetical protein
MDILVRQGYLGKLWIYSRTSMWTLIKGWWDEYIDLMAHSYLLDEAYMELNMDEEFGHGEW